MQLLRRPLILSLLKSISNTSLESQIDISKIAAISFVAVLSDLAFARVFELFGNNLFGFVYCCLFSSDFIVEKLKNVLSTLHSILRNNFGTNLNCFSDLFYRSTLVFPTDPADMLIVWTTICPITRLSFFIKYCL